jgi:hypothetical protein
MHAAPLALHCRRKWEPDPSVGVVWQPTVIAMAEAKEQGPADSLSAISSAMPTLLKAMSLSMPCKAMCEAVVDTCGCGVSHTFGELVDALMSAKEVRVCLLMRPTVLDEISGQFGRR